MFEQIILLIVVYIFARVVFGRSVRGWSHSRDDDDDDDGSDNDPLKAYGMKVGDSYVIKVRMEQINGWWYGYLCTPGGQESFLGQGVTQEAAVATCKQRLDAISPTKIENVHIEKK